MSLTAVSIIIPVYGRTEWIGKCIKNLIGQNFNKAFEIIIVDDGSPNESEMKNASEKFSGNGKITVRYFRNKHAGPAAARNCGVNLSSGQILCFLDDDSLPDEKWLLEKTTPFDKTDAPGIISGRTLSLDRESALPLLLERKVYPEKSWATCNIAYRRDVFEALGGFDESFTEPSWEDNDLGIRAGWAGYKHFYNEKAVVYHPHEKSIEEYKKKCLLNGRGAAAFSRKYIFRKPLWGLGTPIVISRHFIYGILPSVWKNKTINEAYLKFLWSAYSLIGFINAIKEKGHAKD